MRGAGHPRRGALLWPRGRKSAAAEEAREPHAPQPRRVCPRGCRRCTRGYLLPSGAAGLEPTLAKTGRGMCGVVCGVCCNRVRHRKTCSSCTAGLPSGRVWMDRAAAKSSVRCRSPATRRACPFPTPAVCRLPPATSPAPPRPCGSRARRPGALSSLCAEFLAAGGWVMG